jgi:hypothetical protein
LAVGSWCWSGAGRGIGILADESTSIIGRMPMPLPGVSMEQGAGSRKIDLVVT